MTNNELKPFYSFILGLIVGWITAGATIYLLCQLNQAMTKF